MKSTKLRRIRFNPKNRVELQKIAKRLTVNIDVETYRSIRRIARRKGVTVLEAFHHGLEVGLDLLKYGMLKLQPVSQPGRARPQSRDQGTKRKNLSPRVVPKAKPSLRLLPKPD